MFKKYLCLMLSLLLALGTLSTAAYAANYAYSVNGLSASAVTFTVDGNAVIDLPETEASVTATVNVTNTGSAQDVIFWVGKYVDDVLVDVAYDNDTRTVTSAAPVEFSATINASKTIADGEATKSVVLKAYVWTTTGKAIAKEATLPNIGAGLVFLKNGAPIAATAITPPFSESEKEYTIVLKREPAEYPTFRMVSGDNTTTIVQPAEYNLSGKNVVTVTKKAKNDTTGVVEDVTTTYNFDIRYEAPEVDFDFDKAVFTVTDSATNTTKEYKLHERVVDDTFSPNDAVLINRGGSEGSTVWQTTAVGAKLRGLEYIRGRHMASSGDATRANARAKLNELKLHELFSFTATAPGTIYAVSNESLDSTYLNTAVEGGVWTPLAGTEGHVANKNFPTPPAEWIAAQPEGAGTAWLNFIKDTINATMTSDANAPANAFMPADAAYGFFTFMKSSSEGMSNQITYRYSYKKDFAAGQKVIVPSYGAIDYGPTYLIKWDVPTPPATNNANIASVSYYGNGAADAEATTLPAEDFVLNEGVYTAQVTLEDENTTQVTISDIVPALDIEDADGNPWVSVSCDSETITFNNEGLRETKTATITIVSNDATVTKTYKIEFTRPGVDGDDATISSVSYKVDGTDAEAPEFTLVSGTTNEYEATVNFDAFAAKLSDFVIEASQDDAVVSVVPDVTADGYEYTFSADDPSEIVITITSPSGNATNKYTINIVKEIGDALIKGFSYTADNGTKTPVVFADYDEDGSYSQVFDINLAAGATSVTISDIIDIAGTTGYNLNVSATTVDVSGGSGNVEFYATYGDTTNYYIVRFFVTAPTITDFASTVLATGKYQFVNKPMDNLDTSSTSSTLAVDTRSPYIDTTYQTTYPFAYLGSEIAKSYLLVRHVRNASGSGLISTDNTVNGVTPEYMYTFTAPEALKIIVAAYSDASSSSKFRAEGTDWTYVGSTAGTDGLGDTNYIFQTANEWHGAGASAKTYTYSSGAITGATDGIPAIYTKPQDYILQTKPYGSKHWVNPDNTIKTAYTAYKASTPTPEETVGAIANNNKYATNWIENVVAWKKAPVYGEKPLYIESNNFTPVGYQTPALDFAYVYTKEFAKGSTVQIPYYYTASSSGRNPVIYVQWKTTTGSGGEGGGTPPTPTLSNDAKLSKLVYTVGEDTTENTVTGFATTNEGGTYNVTLAAGTTSVTVAATPNDDGANAAYAPAQTATFAAGELSKTITVTVTAEDASTKTYTINFTVEEEIADDPVVTIAGAIFDHEDEDSYVSGAWSGDKIRTYEGAPNGSTNNNLETPNQNADVAFSTDLYFKTKGNEAKTTDTNEYYYLKTFSTKMIPITSDYDEALVSTATGTNGSNDIIRTARYLTGDDSKIYFARSYKIAQGAVASGRYASWTIDSSKLEAGKTYDIYVKGAGQHQSHNLSTFYAWAKDMDGNIAEIGADKDELWNKSTSPSTAQAYGAWGTFIAGDNVSVNVTTNAGELAVSRDIASRYAAYSNIPSKLGGTIYVPTAEEKAAGKTDPVLYLASSGDFTGQYALDQYFDHAPYFESIIFIETGSTLADVAELEEREERYITATFEDELGNPLAKIYYDKDMVGKAIPTKAAYMKEVALDKDGKDSRTIVTNKDLAAAMTAPDGYTFDGWAVDGIVTATLKNTDATYVAKYTAVGGGDDPVVVGDELITGFSYSVDGAAKVAKTFAELDANDDGTYSAVIDIPLAAGAKSVAISDIVDVAGATGYNLDVSATTVDVSGGKGSVEFNATYTDGSTTKRNYYIVRFMVAAPAVTVTTPTTLVEGTDYVVHNVPTDEGQLWYKDKTNWYSGYLGKELANSYLLISPKRDGYDAVKKATYDNGDGTYSANYLYKFTAPQEGTIYLVSESKANNQDELIAKGFERIETTSLAAVTDRTSTYTYERTNFWHNAGTEFKGYNITRYKNDTSSGEYISGSHSYTIGDVSSDAKLLTLYTKPYDYVVEGTEANAFAENYIACVNHPADGWATGYWKEFKKDKAEYEGTLSSSTADWTKMIADYKDDPIANIKPKYIESNNAVQVFIQSDGTYLGNYSAMNGVVYRKTFQAGDVEIPFYHNTATSGRNPIVFVSWEELSSDATIKSVSVDGTATTNGATVTVAGESAKVLAVPNNANAFVKYTVNGTVDNDGVIAVAEGETKVVTIAVTAEDGSAATSFTVTLTKQAAPGGDDDTPTLSSDATLAKLVYTVGEDTTENTVTDFDVADEGGIYNVTLPEGTTSITVVAEKNDENASIDGVPAEAVTFVKNGTAEQRTQQVVITVTAQDETEKTYTINFVSPIILELTSTADRLEGKAMSNIVAWGDTAKPATHDMLTLVNAPLKANLDLYAARTYGLGQLGSAWLDEGVNLLSKVEAIPNVGENSKGKTSAQRYRETAANPGEALYSFVAPKGGTVYALVDVDMSATFTDGDGTNAGAIWTVLNNGVVPYGPDNATKLNVKQTLDVTTATTKYSENATFKLKDTQIDDGAGKGLKNFTDSAKQVQYATLISSSFTPTKQEGEGEQYKYYATMFMTANANLYNNAALGIEAAYADTTGTKQSPEFAYVNQGYDSNPTAIKGVIPMNYCYSLTFNEGDTVEIPCWPSDKTSQTGIVVLVKWNN